MAIIPKGEQFGNAIATSATVRVPAGAFDTSSGLAAAGRAGMQAAMQINEQEVALGRARAANISLDRDLAVKQIGMDIEQQIADGRMPYAGAAAEYRTRIESLGMPDVQGMEATTAENLTRGIKRTDELGAFSVDRAVDKARTADFRGQTDLALDKLGKLAGMPGADVDGITKQVGSLDEIGAVAYGKNWPVKKQEFSDKVWFNQATQRAMANRDSVEGLTALEKDLTEQDGMYAGRLDTEKRNIVLRSVLTDRTRLEAKTQHLADRMEAKAEKTLNDIDQQIASGVPATPEMWAGWAEKVKGTTFEKEFNARINDEVEVQQVLRRPIEEQRAFVQQKEAELLNGGGSVRQKANVQRLRSAVDANLKQLQESPLIFAQNRTGESFPPLDIQALLTPEGVGKVGDTMRDRVNTITALQKQYGSQVQMRPLFPQEAKFLSSALEQATPSQQTQLFAAMRNVFKDDSAYTAAMQQIAPDAPVKAFAGIITAKQRKLTLERNWISDNVVENSGDVAATMLEGESLLNKSKTQKAEDGQSKNFPLPPEKEFRESFASVAGTAFAGRPDAFNVAMQAVRAYYTGRAARDGDVSGQIDGTRMQYAIKAALGDVATIGNTQVLTPWGMDAGTFKDKARESFVAEVKARGMDEKVINQFPLLGLRNDKGNTYYVTQGRNYLYDKKGNPVMITVSQ